MTSPLAVTIFTDSGVLPALSGRESPALSGLDWFWAAERYSPARSENFASS